MRATLLTLAATVVSIVALAVAAAALPFYRSATGSQFAVPLQSPPCPVFQHFTVQQLAADVDVIDFHLEVMGVPWTLWANDEWTPPANWAWTKFMNELAANATETGKPVLLGVLIGRGELADDATIGPDGASLVLTPNWSGACFDFDADTVAANNARNAYIRFVQWMTALFQPLYLNIAIEINLFLKTCPQSWAGMARLERDTYSAVKSVNVPPRNVAPHRNQSLVVFPSFQLDPLYNSNVSGFNYEMYALLNSTLLRDRWAVSAYPAGLKKPDGSGQYISPSDLPADYFVRGGEMGGEQTVIAECGWNTQAIAVNFSSSLCAHIIPTSNAISAEYLAFAMNSSIAYGMELMVWWGYRDLLPVSVMTTCYPADCGGYGGVDREWCQEVEFFRKFGGGAEGELLYKAFGTIGLYDYAGVPKPELLAVWNSMESNQ